MAESGGFPIAFQQRPGLLLKPSQQLKQFVYTPQDLVPVPYPIPWIQNLLAPGAVANVIDMDTGLPTPYVVPVGYTITVIEKSWDFNQDMELWLYFDGLLVSCPGVSNGGNTIDISQIVGYSSALFDPSAAAPHLVDMVVINRGAGNMRGGVQIVTILEAVGTPPFPKEKTTQCPFCKYKQVVKVNTTTIICDSCGRKYQVFDLSKVRRL